MTPLDQLRHNSNSILEATKPRRYFSKSQTILGEQKVLYDRVYNNMVTLFSQVILFLKEGDTVHYGQTIELRVIRRYNLRKIMLCDIYPKVIQYCASDL